MNKGLMALFTAITLAGVSQSFAAAPVIGQIPDVIIGDSEDNGVSDNNLFVFTDAFSFDDYVADADTPDADLIWSFDEGDPAVQWYQINGIDPIHVGTTAQAGDDPLPTDHVNPASNLRAVSATASFRDIVFSPPAGSAPYPDPVEDHSGGKVVTFYVSDGEKVASRDIIVSTVDNGFDSVSSGCVFTPIKGDTFNTDGTGTAWIKNGATLSDTSLNTLDYDSANGAYRVRVFPNSSKYRIAGWNNQKAEWLPYTDVGTGNHVRGKFYMYTTGSPSSSVIPNFSMRLSSRFAVTSDLRIQTHDTNPNDLPLYQELRPSSDPNNPSIYRIDFDPIDVPYIITTPDEGIQSGFEGHELYAQGDGIIALTELVVGTYPVECLDDAAALATQVYDVPLLTHANSMDTKQALIPGGTGEFPAVDSTVSGSITNTASGVHYLSTNVPSNRISYLERMFYAGADGAARLRIAEGEQYKIRWKISSTRAVEDQAWLWLQNRTAKFGYTQYLQLAGGRTSGTGNRTIAQQALPGVGSQNPNNGWYTIIMTSPLNKDIRPETPGATAEDRMPVLASAPVRGDGSSSISNRDIRFHGLGIDTISFSSDSASEASDFTIEAIEVKAFPLVEE